MPKLLERFRTEEFAKPRGFELTNQQIHQIAVTFLRRLVDDLERWDKSARKRLILAQTFGAVYDIIEKYYVHNGGKILNPNRDVDYIILEVALQIQMPDLFPQSRFTANRQPLAA